MAPGGIEPPHAASKAAALSAELRGPAAVVADRLRVTDGTRTHNHRDHNPGLYQLSYGHRASRRIVTPAALLPPQRTHRRRPLPPRARPSAAWLARAHQPRSSMCLNSPKKTNVLARRVR